ncbi:hypothetical protein BaRGS_00019506 [Batillaria attramentaria]|uniref:Uncharacterized protein n=1 Tax=Batillaria attramentaria TaxID=370345 RepID=A0ABD0KQ32_9CAEN
MDTRKTRNANNFSSLWPGTGVFAIFNFHLLASVHRCIEALGGSGGSEPLTFATAVRTRGEKRGDTRRSKLNLTANTNFQQPRDRKDPLKGRMEVIECRLPRRSSSALYLFEPPLYAPCFASVTNEERAELNTIPRGSSRGQDTGSGVLRQY